VVAARDEIAKLAAIVEESRGPLDLPKLPLRDRRFVN
jgi:hypothetical protein